MKRLRVYVAGAYSADNVMDVFTNMRKGMRVGTQLLHLGFAPFVPWLDHHLVFMLQGDESFAVEDFYEYSLSWLRVSDIMLVLPDWENSKGTIEEIKVAERLNIKVFYSLEDLVFGTIRELLSGGDHTEYMAASYIQNKLDSIGELDW